MFPLSSWSSHYSVFSLWQTMSTGEKCKLNKLALASDLNIAAYNHQLEQFTWPNLKSARQRLNLDYFFQCHQLYIFVHCSVTQSRPPLYDPMDSNTPGCPVPHHLPEFAQFHIRCTSDAIQPSNHLPPSFPAFNLSQNHGLFQWAGYLHHVTKILELEFQHQSFQWVFKVDFL